VICCAANGRHLADIGRLQRCPLLCPLWRAKRTWLRSPGMPANDAVDGAHSTASIVPRVVALKANHNEGSRPWARLARSVSILRSRYSRFTAYLVMARLLSASV